MALCLSSAWTSTDLPQGFLTCSRPTKLYSNYKACVSVHLPKLSISLCAFGHCIGSFGLFVTTLVKRQSRLLTTKVASTITDSFFLSPTPCWLETVQIMSKRFPPDRGLNPGLWIRWLMLAPIYLALSTATNRTLPCNVYWWRRLYLALVNTYVDRLTFLRR